MGRNSDPVNDGSARGLDISLTVNGQWSRTSAAAGRILRDFLWEDLGLTGTKEVCEDGMCGSCSVHLDGQAVKS